MKVIAKITGNSGTNGRGAKVIGALMAMLVLVSMVSGSVAAASFVSVTDVEGDDGEQTWEIDLEGDGETSPGDDIRIVTFDDSGDEIDYSNAEVSTNMDDTNLTHFSEGESDLFVEYSVQEGDIGDTLTVSVTGIEVTEDGYENYNVVQVIDPDADEEEDLASGSFDYFSTTAADADDGDETNGDDESDESNGDDDADESDTTSYEFDVVDGEDSVNEFELAVYDGDSLVGDEIVTVEDGSPVTVDGLTVDDEYSVEVTVEEENEDGETQEVTYSESFTADEVEDGEDFVSMTLDLGELEQVEDGTSIFPSDPGDTASGWFDSIVETFEEYFDEDLAFVIGAVVFILLVVLGIIFMIGGVRQVGGLFSR